MRMVCKFAGGVTVNNNKETPEQKREIKTRGIERNPTGSMNDAYNRAGSGGLADLVGSLGWRGTGVLISVIIIGVIIVSRYS